ncbi:PREDICTED: interleukin-37 [Miniopterus natalensis]|uniref:interleukin-37 n=1 Tax=Miniopterus natalensis TaxID=291302 RepID=UPI0007A709EB|nr:PREDICTED: interleukin-37 [Miniopterus natalensis]
MSFQEENADVMDSADWEGAAAQSSSEDPASGALEPGPSLASLSSMHAGPKVANQEPQKFIFYDRDHKVLVLDSGNLIAVPNKSYIKPETFSVLACHKCSGHEKGNIVLLAVSNGELCLCCEIDKKKGQPSLQLKKKKLSHLAMQNENDLKGYTFYRKKWICRNTLESVAHPGWFISTCEAGEPVRMTDKVGRKEHIEFSFVEASKAQMSPSEEVVDASCRQPGPSSSPVLSLNLLALL